MIAIAPTFLLAERTTVTVTEATTTSPEQTFGEQLVACGY